MTGGVGGAVRDYSCSQRATYPSMNIHIHAGIFHGFFRRSVDADALCGTLLAPSNEPVLALAFVFGAR